MEQLSSSQQAPSPSVVHVRHLLVKYCGSRNPTSLKDPTGEKIRQRSIEEVVFQILFFSAYHIFLYLKIIILHCFRLWKH